QPHERDTDARRGGLARRTDRTGRRAAGRRGRRAGRRGHRRRIQGRGRQKGVSQGAAEADDRHLRLLAEFDNYRRRTAKEHEAARREGRRAALLPLLPVLDSLERALATGSTDRDFYDGVAATHRLFLAALREAGAEPIESVGQPFGSNLHVAVVRGPPAGEGAPGT